MEFRRMQVVSWLDSDEHNEELYQLTVSRENPTLQQLASLVLSHNLVKKACMLQQSSDILNRIRAILQLRSNETNKKYYGKENFTTEFKTSIVYPQYSMHPDIQAQTKKILSEICAFLNAEGGTLYLGVNDQGYEFGLDEDMKYKQFSGSQDHYEDYVNNQIALQMSQEASHYVHTHWDEDAKREVLVIEIQPCPDPISLNGVYYERMGKSCRLVNKDYLLVFLANRKQWAKEHKLETKETAQQTVTVSEQTITETKEEVSATPTVITDKVQTSRFRNNVIHDYEEGYVPAVAYICFIDDDEFKVIANDDYKTDDYRLELAVHEDESEDWLLIVYADGNVVRTSVNELLKRDRGRIYKRYGGQDLIYASIVKKDDYLIVGLVDGKGNHRLRFTLISDIDEDNMQSYGVSLCSTSFSGIHYVEVQPKSFFPDWVNLNSKRTDLGMVIKSIKGQMLANMLPECN